MSEGQKRQSGVERRDLVAVPSLWAGARQGSRSGEVRLGKVADVISYWLLLNGCRGKRKQPCLRVVDPCDDRIV